ncbi:MAG: ribbon-helix-helix domain-containing protein [Kiritimatiellales bacterium]
MNVTVNISFEDKLLAEIDTEARRESRSRSELLREAARAYVQRKQRWQDIFAMGRSIAAAKGLTPADVSKEISTHRQAKRRTSV